MARDYKHTVRTGKKTARPSKKNRGKISLWRWMLITALVIGFSVFLTYLRINSSRQPASTPVNTAIAPKKETGKPAPIIKKPVAKEETKPEKTKPAQPHFEFYTVLPNKEAVVPDHEVNTRLREERLGKAKTGKYVMQAGSFKAAADADRLKAKLALMGIESNVEKTKIGDTEWHRVKIGPYAQMGSVDLTKKRLKDNGIDAIVLESAAKAATKP